MLTNSFFPLSTRDLSILCPGQRCRAPLRGVPGCTSDLGCVSLRACVSLCNLPPKKKPKRKSFSHFITSKPPFFLFFFGGHKKTVEIWESSKLCPSTAAWLGFSRNSSQLPYRWRKPMSPWMWRKPWWRRSGRQWKLHCRNLDRWKFGS